ncbi:hypothetical protein PROFUN_08562 [Planoprotostelium fungivorum]|uniref:Uncharacterized protein n=1 Tax=Planoprotostelium fungivorum TaxID=1890364 RepID=A0A2P6N1P3_9EUKA|nr:hypothetical protein PROFUN_08562 [Planoprotostelium fungivorum]
MSAFQAGEPGSIPGGCTSFYFALHKHLRACRSLVPCLHLSGDKSENGLVDRYSFFRRCGSNNNMVRLLIVFALLALCHGSTLTLVNNCDYQLSICSSYLAHVFDMDPYTKTQVDASGNTPYNQCGNVQAEFNFNGWGDQDCYDLSEVAVPFSGAPTTIYGVNGGPDVSCSSTPCGDAYNFPNDDSKNHCVPSGGDFFVQFC